MESAQGKENKIRVVLAKPGLDGHDRGVKIVARALSNAGMEVIYMGLRVTPEQIVVTALEEDADVIGISNHSAVHVPINQEILELLRQHKADNIVVVAGGTILEEDRVSLEGMGVAACFTAGTPTEEIVSLIREKVKQRQSAI
jgi:methylmalonyl-CoA mutase cobalamin-binding domain/chain